MTLNMSIGAAIVESSMENSQNLKIELSYDTAILVLGIQLKKTKNTAENIYIHSSVHNSIIYNG